MGNLLGGFLADRVFEPYMKKSGSIQMLLERIVGHGNGSGIALIYMHCYNRSFGMLYIQIKQEHEKLRELTTI